MKTRKQPSPAAAADAGPDAGARSDQVLRALDRFERPLIHYVARVLGGDLERARDVTQETFLRLCDAPLMESEPRLAAWLFKVGRNLALDVRRKEKRMEPMTEAATHTRQSDDLGPAQAAEQRDAASRVAVAILGLPGSQQEILQLRFQQGMSYRELADVTGRSVSAVGVLVHKGIRTLRKRLGNELGILPSDPDRGIHRSKEMQQ